jgi:hypothetical protein
MNKLRIPIEKKISKFILNPMRGLFGKYELSNMVQCVLVKNHFANRHWLTSLYVCSVNICRPNGFWSKDMDNWNFCQKLKFSLEMSEKPRRLNQNELLQLFRYIIAEFQFFAKISIVNVFWSKIFCPTDICSTDINSFLITTMRLIAKKTTTSILDMPREVSIYFQVNKVTSQSRLRITVGQLMLTLFDQFKYWKLYYCFIFNLFWSFYLQFEKFHTLGGALSWKWSLRLKRCLQT